MELQNTEPLDFGWLRTYIQPSDEHHVYPEHEAGLHVLRGNQCWCYPLLEPVGDGLIVSHYCHSVYEH